MALTCYTYGESHKAIEKKAKKKGGGGGVPFRFSHGGDKRTTLKARCTWLCKDEGLKSK